VTIELDSDFDFEDEAFTIRATEKELRILQRFIDAAIVVKDSSGVFNETDFKPVVLSIHCEEADGRDRD
jgi:hypothetical protein